MKERNQGPNDGMGKRPVIHGERMRSERPSIRIENAEARGDEHLFTCAGAPSPVVRSSRNGLNALRNPRNDSTCGMGTTQGHRDVKLANPSGGVRL